MRYRQRARQLGLEVARPGWLAERAFRLFVWSFSVDARHCTRRRLNVLVNPLHPDAGKISATKVRRWLFDLRLKSKGLNHLQPTKIRLRPGEPAPHGFAPMRRALAPIAALTVRLTLGAAQNGL